jgi:Putative auto-transporter adhesin, head GIN domain
MTTAPTPLPHRFARDPLTVSLLLAVLAALVAVLVLLARDNGGSSSSTLRGSGTPATQTRSLPAFTAVDLAGANQVAVHVGAAQAVTVRADDNLIRYVTTMVTGGTLVVDQSRSFTTSGPMDVDVSVPSLAAVRLSGSGILTIDGVRGARFAVDVPGSGVVTVAGSVTRLDATLSGSGDVRLQGLTARDVTASVLGSGRLQVDATRSLDASLSGSGAIFYGGDPTRVSQRVTGTGAIVRR